MKFKTEIDITINKFIGKKGALIPLLQEVQTLEGYLEKDTMRYLSEKTGFKISKLYGVATFYSMFRLKPQGKYTVRVCKGTACHVAGANIIYDTILNELGLANGEDTSRDKLFTIVEVACLGCCGLAPAIMINEDVHGKLSSEKARKVIQEIRSKEGGNNESRKLT
ncbi:MAG: NAD(P)H-dependent oxidoreductase subunit E [Candidatus Tenebribacter davisii]|jgi:NADH-quinone oxidoreductase subunit E|nr:NAD(P)H-dependent oxidoreductase subunit E [Candidatus Tenebribacter davisii]